ncbi:MAG TPA: hypothetical protein VG895_00975 [Patescibacteria group bacterium]|nr:hypothetical protein [Patescibacteria group bacterium]
MAIENEVIIKEDSDGHKRISFQKTDRDGTTLKIDRCMLSDENGYDKTLIRQLERNSYVQVKFCVQIDEESDIDPDESIEKWEVVFFPMFDRHGDEVRHGSVVDFEDSIINGNLIVENGFVTDMSSNHLDPEYATFQIPILYFSKVWLQNYINEIKGNNL